MKLKFFNPETVERNIRATAHKSGKLGFTIEAAKKLRLGTDKSAAIAINEDDKDDKNLYVIIHPGKAPGTFAISKAGDYYYINTKPLFDSQKIDYENQFVSFDISEDTIDGQQMYVFKAKIRSRRTNDEN